ncbi:hypothetical protein [Roseimaritima ulvae]|uniref:MoxR-vWA-beta-propeller ternary system domain-containing protein n=1 Tax=Roseimaritima ulvae TaxID=980254 RepID=A0A5B9QPF4_9BACT|nr:hypothetical protein [Roseimaritima ulvae]QEG39809.1 hypothetical protein UC8_18080 [Roseimaritima ulvae]
MLHATGKSAPAAMRYVRLWQPLDASLVGELLVAGAELAQHEQVVWLRLPASQSGSQELLRKLPGGHYLDVQAEATDEAASGARTLLRRPGQQVPTASLPGDLSWQLIDQCFDFALPAPGIGAQAALQERPPLRLERGGNQRTAAAMIVSLSELAAWVDTAAAVRMQPLLWLRRADQALVFGTPLPPLDGVLFAACEQVLLPVGFRWQPDLPASSVFRAFCHYHCNGTAANVDQQSDAAWLIWESNRRWRLVDDDDWVSLTRASVRAAQEK